MRKNFSDLANYLIFIIIFFITLFTIFNSFPLEGYVPVHKKWFLYGEVVPPKDYDDRTLRPIDIDLLAPKENSEFGDFYWLQTSGDLLTLTNRNFSDVIGTVSFNLDVDPCGIERSIFVGTQDGSIEAKTNKEKSVNVNFQFQISSNTSQFFSIVGEAIKPCKIKEELNRDFMARITELKVLRLTKNDQT